MNALRYIRLVLWSFFGVRRGADASEDVDKARLVPLLVTAIALAISFALLLIVVASLAAGALG